MRRRPNDAQGEHLAGAKLLWIETPSNPTMEICDIAALCEKAHAAGALVAVDNTTATALGQRPLALGADFSVASDTKSMTGHSDILLGHVATRDRELLQKIDQWRTLMGGVLGPMEAWLALRSIATLPLRLERSSANAQRIAEFLSTRTEVQERAVSGAEGRIPGTTIAARQMQYFGAVLSFELADKAAAERFFAKAKLVTEATSFGGTCTCAERRARWGGDAVPEGFIRMSAGLEDADDLLADIGQALDAVHGDAGASSRASGGRRCWSAAADCAGAAVRVSATGGGRGRGDGARSAAACGAGLRAAVKFLATCARGFADPRMPTGLFACPNAREMCAVAGGYAYMVDTQSPESVRADRIKAGGGGAAAGASKGCWSLWASRRSPRGGVKGWRGRRSG